MNELASAAEGKAAPSAARGVLGGLCGTVLAVPLLAVSLIVAEFLKRSLLSKLLGHEVSYETMRRGSESFMGEVVVGVATGLIGACVAATLALKLVRKGAPGAFRATMTAGLTLVLAGAFLWLRARTHFSVGSLTFYVLLAWAGALAGMFLAASLDEYEEEEAAAPAVEADPA